MSWTDIFKSRSWRTQPDARVRWFGKLPVYADYFSSPAEEDWAVEFNNWVLRGFEEYQNRRSAEGDAGGGFGPFEGVLRLPQSGMTVFASIRDHGGDLRGRPFPLCFYCGMPSNLWRGPTSGTAPTGLWVVRELGMLHDEAERVLKSPERLDGLFQDRDINLSPLVELQVSDAWREAAGQLPLAEWLSKTQGDCRTNADADWLSRVSRWCEEALKGKGADGRVVVLPLAHGFAFESQIAGWLHWIGLRTGLERRELSVVVHGTADAECGRLVVIFRPVEPADFVLGARTPALTDAPGVEASPVDGRGAGEAAEPAEAGPRARPAGTWLDFVEASSANLDTRRGQG